MHQSSKFKALTSGLDTIDGENKFQAPFSFRNTAKLTFSANKIPEGPKDEAYYQRWILIEFANRFRGTTKEVKGIITSLTTERELSGLLNLALKGLKKLKDTGAFSYTKTFAEVEKEYLLNSNPSAAFMDECIVMSTEDLDATILYATFTEWCRTHNTELVTKIGFSRKISEMGYDSHRENEVNPITKKVNNNKKVIVWDNIQLRHTTNINKQKELGQDEKELGQDRKKSSCPEIKSQQTLVRQPKTVLGQDDFSFVVNKNENRSLSNDNIEDVNKSKMSYSEKLSGKVKISCPSVCFFDSEPCGQDYLKKPVSSCPSHSKPTSLNQNDDSYSKENLATSDLLSTDLKNSVVVTAEDMAKAWEEEGV